MLKKKVVWGIVLLGIFLNLTVVPLAFAEEAGSDLQPWTKSFIALAGGFGISLAAAAGVLAQAKSIAAGLEGIARNPGASGKIQTPMIIGLAFQESLVLYALVVSFMLILKF